jgi:hypothetical protein
VGDVAVADRHGRRVGFAALSALEGMLRPGAKLKYRGVVESGAPLAVWRAEDSAASNVTAAAMRKVELALKPLAPLAELEEQWRTCEDPVLKERLWRKRGVRKVVGDGATAAMGLWVWRVGDAFIVGQPNETYSEFQLSLRREFRPEAVAVLNIVNGSAGFLPSAEMFDKDVYQVGQSPFEKGSLEAVMAAARETVNSLR